MYTYTYIHIWPHVYITPTHNTFTCTDAHVRTHIRVYAHALYGMEVIGEEQPYGPQPRSYQVLQLTPICPHTVSHVGCWSYLLYVNDHSSAPLWSFLQTLAITYMSTCSTKRVERQVSARPRERIVAHTPWVLNKGRHKRNSTITHGSAGLKHESGYWSC